MTALRRNATRSRTVAFADAAPALLNPGLAACFACRPGTNQPPMRPRAAGILAELASGGGRD